jgi:uncharacterized delta-60 repeat protein
LTPDASFTFDQYKWPGASIAGVVVASDGSLYVAGTVSPNTSQEHVVVRHFTSKGKYDDAFVPSDDQMPKEIDARGFLPAADGGFLVETNKGFTPAILRLTKTGAPDVSFGTGGLLVLDDLGPRYERAMIVDEQNRILVLGMSSDTLQIIRLQSNGTTDGAFGKAGIATYQLDTKPLSSQYDEHAEARGMMLDVQGRIVVSADYSYTQGTGTKPTEETLRLVRFDASGKLDASFGDKGVAKIDFGPGTTSSRNLYRAGIAPLGDRHLLVGGTKTTGTTSSYAIACVEM